MTSKVNGLPSEITELAQERARAANEKSLEIGGRRIVAIDVYEVMFPEDPL